MNVFIEAIKYYIIPIMVIVPSIIVITIAVQEAISGFKEIIETISKIIKVVAVAAIILAIYYLIL